eukprot:246380_1
MAMNALRQMSARGIRNGFKRPSLQAQRLLFTKYHHRTFRKNPSPFFRQRVTLLNKNPNPSFLTSRKFSVFGASVMGSFIKTSGVFFAIPVTAALSPYINTLPFDAVYGCLLPYHTYIGLHHIFTDYFAPSSMIIAYIVVGIMFIGLQNLNFQGEGISPMVRRVFVKEKISTKKKIDRKK